MNLIITALFIVLIVLAITHAKQEYSTGLNDGFNTALDKFEEQNLFKIDKTINPVVVRTTCVVKKERIENYKKTVNPTEKEFMTFILEDSDKEMSSNLIKELVKQNLIYREVSIEADGSLRVDYGLVLTENKDNFYRQMFYSADYETSERQSN